MNASAPRLRRTAFGPLMIVLTVLAIAFEAPSVVAPWLASPTYGWQARPDGTVLAVSPGEPAARAGVRAGDHILGGGTRERVFRLRFPRAGDVGLVEHGGRTIAVAAALVRANPTQAWAASISNALSLPLIAFAGFLCRRRPGMMTLAFWLYAIGQVSSFWLEVTIAPLPDAVALPLDIAIIAIVGIWEFYPLLLFALRFPHDRLDRAWERIAERIWIAASIAVLVYSGFASYDILGGLTYLFLQNAPLPLVVAALVWRYGIADAATRRRVAWAILGISVAAIAATVGNLAFEVAIFQGATVATIANAFLVLSALGPYAFVYATLRHRLLDVTFVLNRTVVFGALAALVVTIVGAIDWGVGKLLSNTRAAIAVEAAATIALGFVLDRVHAVLERAVDRFVFAKRHAAEHHLERVTAGLQYAESREAVLDALVDEPVRALRLKSAAVFVLKIGAACPPMAPNDGERYARAYEHGWRESDAPSLALDDPLVRLLRAERTVIDIADARWERAHHLTPSARPEVAVPLLMRDDLLGIAFYGQREDATTLDPEERRFLRRLGDAGAIAYEAVDAKEAKRALAAANARLAALGMPVLEGDPARG